jgi:hypothetical protein
MTEQSLHDELDLILANFDTEMKNPSNTYLAIITAYRSAIEVVVEREKGNPTEAYMAKSYVQRHYISREEVERDYVRKEKPNENL